MHRKSRGIQNGCFELARGTPFQQCVSNHDDRRTWVLTAQIALSNSNRHSPTWSHLRSKGGRVRDDRHSLHAIARLLDPSTQSIGLGSFFGKRRINSLRQIVPRQPHPNFRQWQILQLASRGALPSHEVGNKGLGLHAGCLLIV